MTKRSATDSLSLLLSVAAFLSKHGSSTVKDLAKHFGVTEAEIVATAKTIGFSGVGSYSFDETFKLDYSALDDGYVEFIEMVAVEDVPKLSTAEAAIFISGLNYLKSLPEFANDRDIENLLALLQAGSNAPQTRFFEIRPGTLEYDYMKIRGAIASQVRIRCEYTNLKGEHSERELDPLRLESRDQNFYLQAYCLRDEMVKFFKLDQMRITEITNTPICEAALNSEKHEEIFEAAETDVEVVVELEPEAFSIAAEFAAGDSVINLEDGRIRATIRIGYLPYLGKLIAEFGGAAVVMSPPEARAVVRDFALRSLGEAGLSESKLRED